MDTIRTERLRRSLTQKRLAFEAGIDPRTLRKIEKGEKVSPESVLSVCSVLGLDAAELSKPNDQTHYGRTLSSSVIRASVTRSTLCSFNLLTLAPFAILLPVAIVAFNQPQWSVQALIVGTIISILFAVLNDLPSANKHRSIVGAGLIIIFGIVFWDRQMTQFGDVNIHFQLLLGIFALAMVSPGFRNVIIPVNEHGERSFERILLGLILVEVSYLTPSSLDFKGLDGLVSFYRAWGYPVVQVAALTLMPFRRLRGVGFLAVGILHAVRLPDFPVQIYYGGNTQVSAAVFFEMSLTGVFWDLSVGILAMICAIPNMRSINSKRRFQ